MKRLPHFLLGFVAILFVAADKKQQTKATPSPAQIQQWVKQLGDNDFRVREEGTRDLINAGEDAIDAVTKATKSEDAEVKQRALRILNHPEKTAIAYFKKLGGSITVGKKNSAMAVIGLDLRTLLVTEAELVYLKGLIKLQEVELTGITYYAPGPRLGGPSFETEPKEGITITDAGLVHLKGLSNLQELYLDDTKVTDAGLVHLKGLTELQKLELRGTKVTQPGIEQLQKALPNCGIDWEKDSPARTAEEVIFTMENILEIPAEWNRIWFLEPPGCPW